MGTDELQVSVIKLDDDEGNPVEVQTVHGTVSIGSSPASSFTFNCSDLSCTFVDRSTDADGSVNQWSWDFGDGNTSTEQNPSHTYASAGTYTVELTVTDNDDAIDTTSENLEVSEAPTNNPPIAFFMYICSDLSCAFTDMSTDSDGGIKAFSWDFGDGSVSASQNPSHTYASGGTYTVELAVTDSDGAIDSMSRVLEVSEPVVNESPNASFTYSCDDLSCVFIDASTDIDGSIIEWSWDFGDSNASTEQNPSHAYASADTYTVELTVTDNDGATNSFTQSVVISESPVTVTLTANNSSGIAGSKLSIPIVLNEASLGLAGFAITTILSDGSVASITNAEFPGYGLTQYNQVSNSEAYLTAADLNGVIQGGASNVTLATLTLDALGGGTTDIQIIVVRLDDDEGNHVQVQTISGILRVGYSPVASFAFTCNDLSCVFTDGSTDPDGNIQTWRWSFGDGSASASQNPSHAYASGGTYTVELTVTDDDGAANTVSQDITVSEPVVNVPPTASFIYTCNDISCVFTDMSTDPDGNIQTWRWSFGDGSVSASQNPSHAYASGGTYTVELTVTDSDGAIDSMSKILEVSEPVVNESPNASFTYSCDDLSCVFIDASTDIDGSIIEWSWDFGDGSVSASQNPSHIYASGGTYTVELTVTDDDEATSTSAQSISVSNPLEIIHVHDLDSRSEKLRKGGWKAVVTIVVYDTNKNPVGEATVTGTFHQRGKTVGPFSCVTDVNGVCAMDSGQLPRKKGSATFTVNDVIHRSLAYDPSSNHDPDGDSNGTSISLSK